MYLILEEMCGNGKNFEKGKEYDLEKQFSKELIESLSNRNLIQKIEEVKELSEEEKLTLSKNTKDKK